MTDEEIAVLQASAERLTAQVDDLTAERDSLREELEAVRARYEETSEEMKEIKKLNYTLARQMDTRKKDSFDETLVSLYGGVKK